MQIRYVHTSIVARDWKTLSRFYVRALCCTPKPPERNLKGKWLDSATSLRGAHYARDPEGNIIELQKWA